VLYDALGEKISLAVWTAGDVTDADLWLFEAIIQPDWTWDAERLRLFCGRDAEVLDIHMRVWKPIAPPTQHPLRAFLSSLFGRVRETWSQQQIQQWNGNTERLARIDEQLEKCRARAAKLQQDRARIEISFDADTNKAQRVQWRKSLRASCTEAWHRADAVRKAQPTVVRGAESGNVFRSDRVGVGRKRPGPAEAAPTPAKRIKNLVPSDAVLDKAVAEAPEGLTRLWQSLGSWVAGLRDVADDAVPRTIADSGNPIRYAPDFISAIQINVFFGKIRLRREHVQRFDTECQHAGAASLFGTGLVNTATPTAAETEASLKKY